MAYHRLTEEFNSVFADMAEAYFTEIAAEELSSAVIRAKIVPFLLRQYEKGLVEIVIAADGIIPFGFAIFQIDRPESDWCKRPGWGFIREFYVAKACRNQGLGRCLARETEVRLLTCGAKRLYLQADNAAGFWTACGWHAEPRRSDAEMITFTKHAWRFHLRKK